MKSSRWTQQIAAFVKALGKNTRGEDLTEKSSGLSNAGKVAMAAVVIAAAAAGLTQLVNNANTASDTTSKNVNSAVGAQTTATQVAKTPYAVPQ